MRHLHWLLLIPGAIVLAGLIAGAPWLLWPTPAWPELPLGNATLWIAMIMLACFVMVRRPAGLLRATGWIALLCAAFWGLTGRLFSGNWRFSFEEGIDGTLWWQLSIALGALLIINMLWSLLASRASPKTSAKLSADSKQFKKR